MEQSVMLQGMQGMDGHDSSQIMNMSLMSDTRISGIKPHAMSNFIKSGNLSTDLEQNESFNFLKTQDANKGSIVN